MEVSGACQQQQQQWGGWLVTMLVHSISQLVSSYTSFWHNHHRCDPTMKDHWSSSPKKASIKVPNTEPTKGNILLGECCQAAYLRWSSAIFWKMVRRWKLIKNKRQLLTILHRPVKKGYGAMKGNIEKLIWVMFLRFKMQSGSVKCEIGPDAEVYIQGFAEKADLVQI